MSKQSEKIQELIKIISGSIETTDQSNYEYSFRTLQGNFENLEIQDNSFEDFTESCISIFYAENISTYPDELFRGLNWRKVKNNMVELYRDLKTNFCEYAKGISAPTEATIDLVIQGILAKIVSLIPGITFIAGLYVTAACYYWMKSGVVNFCG